MPSNGQERPAAAAEPVPWRLVRSASGTEQLWLPGLEQQRLDGLLSHVRAHVWGEGDAVLALFTGKPGTGKSLAARLLAAEIGAPLVEVDAVAAAARGTAGAAAALWLLLREGERQRAVLVFEDAVALLRAVRTEGGLPAHLARYPGVIILCSRVAVRLPGDQAARFSAIVDFPFPEAPARGRFWHAFLPPGSMLGEADLDYLAGTFALSAGTIAQTCARAAAQARAAGEPLQRRHLATALELHFSQWLLAPATRQAIDQLRGDAPSTESA